MIETGRIELVQLVTVGSNLTGDYAAGAVLLAVADAAVFDASGGSVAVNHYVDDELTQVIYDYSVVDYDADTVTLAVPLAYDAEEGTPVRTHPPTVEKRANVRKDHGGDSVVARVPHNLEPYLLDGIRDPDAEEAVTITLTPPRGQWVVADIHGKDPVARTTDYTPGEAGSSFGVDATQFENVNVTDTLGVSHLTAEDITLGGDDLIERIDRGGRGLIAFGQGDNVVDTALVSAETIAFQIDLGGPLTTDRFYLVCLRGALTDAATVGSLYRIRARLSLASQGAAAPADLSDDIWDGSTIDVVPDHTDQRASFNNFWLWQPSLNFSDIKTAITLTRSVGTGSGAIVNTPNLRFQMFIVDLGSVGFAGGAIAQKSKSLGTPDPDPISAYSGTWQAIDGVSYDENGQQRQSDDAATYLYQGRDPHDTVDEHGNTRSLVLFDWPDMVAKLAGATIVKVTLTFRVAFSATYSGYAYSGVGGGFAGGFGIGTLVRVRSNNNPDLPDTFTGGGEIASTLTPVKPGATYTLTLPIAYGFNVKNGLARGIGFGPGTDDRGAYFGGIYATGPSRPTLRIYYTK